MKGIVAGESNVEIERTSKHFRVFISAKEFEERKLYQNCLEKLGIRSTNYENFHGLVISQKENLLQLLEQKIMSGSLQKYSKFLQIKTFYNDSSFLQSWEEKNKQGTHNKVKQSKINEILSAHKQHPGWPAWKIAEQVEVSAIKVQRIRKEYTLGIQRPKKTKEEVERVLRYQVSHPEATSIQIAKATNVHEAAILRIRRRFSIKKGRRGNAIIPAKILEKYSETMRFIS
ncbi:hypothetical protein HZA96_00975 [Candidatus Woesearchaeota archaeon]|nr:hypothetical protein [Candidatus Woesearchaeota archaeon]